MRTARSGPPGGKSKTRRGEPRREEPPCCRVSAVFRCSCAVGILVGFVFEVSCDRSTPAPPTTAAAAKSPAARGPAFRRIVSISPNATETAAALGAADRLVAVSDFCVWPPQVKSLPRVGGLFDANLETILLLHPDLVILRGANRGVEQLCAESGIALYRDRTESLADISKTLDELGDLLDCRDRAEQVRREMRQRLERIRRGWESALSAGAKQPRVLVTLARDGGVIGSVMTGSRGTFIDDMIRHAGGINVFADTAAPYPSVSQEAIMVARPEVIVEMMPEAPPSAELEERLRAQWHALGPLPAVESGRIHVLFDENAMIPSPRIVEIIDKLARLFHPEAEFD